jgi:putative ABC transport system substrate-binding protein
MATGFRRREFIALFGAIAAWPCHAGAQGPAKIPRIGIITEGMRSPPYEEFRRGLQDLGYVEGKNLFVEWRFAGGRFVRIPGFVEEFQRLKTDVIFVGSPATVYAVREATHTIPIVMGYSIDPVGSDLVASMAHPGGNVTGLASATHDAPPRQIELLTAVIPNLARVGLLQNPDDPGYALMQRSTRAEAQQSGVHLIEVDARDPQDLDEAFAALARDGAQAVKIAPDRTFFREQERLAELALQRGLPSIFSQRDYTQAGGLISYGESLNDFYYRAAVFVDRILKGAKPGDLPIEQPTKLELVINLKTAKALGLVVPQALLKRADAVIE